MKLTKYILIVAALISIAFVAVKKEPCNKPNSIAEKINWKGCN